MERIALGKMALGKKWPLGKNGPLKKTPDDVS
jgi:hypothetical protein